jgi:hypothetical protein
MEAVMGQRLRYNGIPGIGQYDDGKIRLPKGASAAIPDEITLEDAKAKVAEFPKGSFEIITDGERQVTAPASDRMKREAGQTR